MNEIITEIETASEKSIDTAIDTSIDTSIDTYADPIVLETAPIPADAETVEELETVEDLLVTDETVEVTEITESSLGNISFEPMNFVDNLGYMGIGMLGIFIVIAAIWVVTLGLNKFFSGKKKDEE